MTVSVQQLYSTTAGKKPGTGLVQVGQFWINLADNVIGTKNAEGQIVTYGQLTEAERDSLLSGGGVYIPKVGVVSGVSMSEAAETISGDSITVDDDSTVVLSKTLDSNGVIVNVTKTTGHKATKIVFSKPAGLTCTISWSGVDSWLSTAEAPVFGESTEAQELCVAVFTSPTHTAVNVVYNTENPSELDISGVEWGNISGSIAAQTDLQNALDAKANASELTQFAPKTNAAFTGTLTLNGEGIATVSQIPSLDGYLTTSVASTTYLTKNDASTTYLTQANAGTIYLSQANANTTYLKKADAESTYATVTTVNALTQTVSNKANSSALSLYLPLSGGTMTGSLNVQTPTSASNAANKSYVDEQISNLNIAQYAPLASPAFTGTATIGGQQIATVNQIPSLSGYLTTSAASSTYATIASPALTGTATLNGQTIATVNQIPNVSQFITADASINGNAATATQLETGRTIAISGAVTGTATLFDGSQNITIDATQATDSTKIALTGDRGSLAGYEGITTTTSALTINENSPDSQQVNAAVQITVNNGAASQSWTKKVSITNSGASIVLGGNWSWVGGSQPTLTVPCLLVLSWDNNYGMAVLNTTGG